MNLFHRLAHLLTRPLKYRFSFRVPHRTRIVIYPDGKSADVLLNCVERKETQVLAPFGNTINVPVFFRMLLGFQWSRFSYLLSYLKFVKPSMVITTLDNDPNFYRINSYLPAITTIAIQNGIRGNLSAHPRRGFFDLLQLHSLNHDLRADYICTFGTAIQEEYKKFISTDFIASGSLRNNFFVNTNIEEKQDRLAYVSGISDYPSDPDQNFLYLQDLGITFKEFYEAEGIICALLAEYCAGHNLEFVICGKRSSSSSVETSFYKTALGGAVPKISPRDDTFDSYKFLSTARFVVTLDSTIAYEFLSRKKRTAFISARFNQLNNAALDEHAGFRFGYPQSVPQFGQFWSSVLSESEIERVIDNLKNLTNDEWEQAIEPFCTSLMVYDPGNSELKRLIKNEGRSSTL